ncbi:MAG: nuclear transport factor 2 family protein [Chthoniobacterales bacterium]|nr:nuclear transport factor 2 family protein [Chthoniobacterales bacterium]
MENRWLAALQAHDAAAVNNFVADNYIGVTATGRFVNKAALLANIKKDKNVYESAANTRTDVRVHGDTAVIVGTTRQVGKDEAGKAFTYYYRWTDTWALRNGQWLCVASQSIQVPK